MSGASIVPVHYVNQFNSNVFLVAQQKSSRLRGLVRTESQNGENQFFDYYGMADEPQERVGKYDDLKPTETARNRRKVNYKNYTKTEWFSELDKLNMIHDPKAPVAQSFASSFGRKMDRIIIEACLGTAYDGKEGQVPVALPNSQKIVAFDGTTTSGVGLNIDTLRAIKKKFNQNEVEGDIILVYTSEEESSLLNSTEVTSADYNTVKALVNGSVDQFMGIRFIRTELVPRLTANVTYNPANGEITGAGTVTAAKSRRCVAFVGSGVVHSIAEDMTSRVSLLDIKGDVYQLFSKMSMGGTRLEEVTVVEVITSEK